MKFDRIIKGGMIIDGTRQARFYGDLGIKDGKIAAIGRLSASDAAEVLDAIGLIVAPGFIDLHTHYDAQVFWDPYCSISSWHGVTTVAVGNCGIGFAPVRAEDRDAAMQSISRIEAVPYATMKEALPWTWETFPEYLDAVDATPKAVNFAAYLPATPLLIWAMGRDEAKSGRSPSEAEYAEMRRVVIEAMEAGALGWSSQYQPPKGNMCLQRDFDGTPMVTDTTPPETFYELAKAMRDHGSGLIQFLQLLEDQPAGWRITERIAEIAGTPVLWNTVASSDASPEGHRAQLAWLESCRSRGLRISGQAFVTRTGYTFTMEDWNLFDAEPLWKDITVGTREEKLAKMADPALRDGLKAHIPMVAFDFGKIRIEQCRLEKNKTLLDKPLRQLEQETGRHMVDLFLDIAVEEDLETVFAAPQPVNNDMANLREVVDDPLLIMLDSDGGAHAKFMIGGVITTEVMVNFVRERAWMTLEDAHWRLSALPALLAGFRDRGTLTVGSAADIIVYDLEKLGFGSAEVAHDLPAGEWRRVSQASGYRYVLVNGEVTIDNGRQTGRHSGVLLRGGVG